MNSLFQYTVNRTNMDLFPNTASPKLRRIAEELNDPTKRGLDSSFKLSIPKTANNLNALGITEAVGGFGLFEVVQNESLLSFQSLVILEGITEVDAITDTDIQVIVYSRFLTFVDTVKEQTLQDLTFPKLPWYYENTIRNHVNRDYKYDDIVQPVNMFNTGEQIGAGKNLDYDSDAINWNISPGAFPPASTKTIRVPFAALKSVTYTFRYTMSDVSNAGVGSMKIILMSDDIEQYSFTLTLTTGMTTGTFNITTAGVTCNYLAFRVTATIGLQTGKLLNLEQITPTPTDEVVYQFPTIIYERFYTVKKTIDAVFKTYISGSGAGARYLRGSSTSDGQDYQRGQFLILNDPTPGAGAGVAKYQDDGVDAETIPNFVDNYAEYGNFPSAMYVGKVFKQIAKQAGWQISGSLLQNEEFKKLIIVATGDGQSWDSAIVSTYNREEAANDLFKATRITTNQSLVIGPSGVVWNVLLFNFEDLDPNARYSPSTGKYTFGENYRASFTAFIVGQFQGTPFSSSTTLSYVAWRIMSSIKGEITRYVQNASFSGSINVAVQTSTIDFAIGEEVWVEMGGRLQSVLGSVQTNFTSNFLNTIVGGTGEVAKFDPVAFLPKMKQLDFIKEFILIPFNAYMYVNDSTKTIYVEAYENFILPVSQAFDISDQVLNDKFKTESINVNDRSANIIFDENNNDNVPFLPNQLNYPTDYSRMVRFRKKQLTIDGKIYKNNEIFNTQGGVKSIQSKLAPVNFRKFTIIQSTYYTGNFFASDFPLPVYLPVISTVDDLKQEWFSETSSGLDNRPFASDLSFGDGLRMLKYDGIGTWQPNIGYNVYWLNLSDPGFHSTSGYLGENVRFKMKIGMTSYTADSTYLIDDSYNQYYNTSAENGKISPLNLSASNLYKYSNENDPSQPIIGWQTNDNGTFTIVRDDLYTLHYAKKYETLAYSDLLTVDIYMNEQDWNRLQVNVPVIINTVAYSLIEISNYEPTSGLATITLLKKLN